MKKGEDRKTFRKIGWWIIILVMVILLLWGVSSKWKWFSPPHTWSDIAMLIQEVEEKTQKLNQILQEALQSGEEKETSLGP
ncbi:MAG: hypothetical protein PWP57_695 [Candidatus Atribacteria bacterium]|nr:hypothetical protein [Candidatus Atribacteria bacterium]